MRTKLVVSMVCACAAFAGAPAVASAQQPQGGYVYVDRGPAAPAEAIGPGLILYFNKNAATYTPGNDDSRQNRSSVPITTSSLGAWNCSEPQWQQFMTCIRDMYSPFNVTVTDVDPGNTPHVETHVGGSPTSMKTQQYPQGLPCGNQGCVGGIAPLGCYGGVDNAITYVFSNIYQCDVQGICEAAAQESAHAFGLDHEAYCPDPMTYDTDCGAKEFRDHDAPCGEYEGQPRQCKCPGTGSTQNSYQELLAMFGPNQNPNDAAPSCAIAKPTSGATVSAGFTVEATASDDLGVARVELWIDNQQVTTKNTAPYTFIAPASLQVGSHTLMARAVDSSGQSTDAQVTVTLAAGMSCQAPADCPSGQVCQAGACVPGPGTPGGLGEGCTDSTDCNSGLCGAGPGGMKCTETCDPAASSCPLGFDCLSTGQGGACWPGAGGGEGDDDNVGGGCGCLVGGSAPRAPLVGFLVGFAFVAWPLWRRRRR